MPQRGMKNKNNSHINIELTVIAIEEGNKGEYKLMYGDECI